MSTELSYPIRLDQYLKLSNLVGSGGEAKILITNGQVRVNDELELRRGRKLQAGDRVDLEGHDTVTVGA